MERKKKKGKYQRLMERRELENSMSWTEAIYDAFFSELMIWYTIIAAVVVFSDTKWIFPVVLIGALLIAPQIYFWLQKRKALSAFDKEE